MNSERHILSVAIDPAKCRGCMACMRVCPTEAVRVRRRRAAMIEERCVNCGKCIRECPYEAIMPRTSSFTEMSQFKHTVALASPVLYGQFGRDVLPSQIIAGLRKIGFDDSYDTSRACEAVTMAVDEYVASGKGSRPLISSLCPVVVRLVQVRFPELVDHIIPIRTPREMAAWEVKHQRSEELGLDPDDVGVIYLTACPAKMAAVIQPAEEDKSPIDGAISIADVYGPLLSAISQLMPEEVASVPDPSGNGLGWVIPGGVSASFDGASILTVSGLADVITVLEDIETHGMRDIEYISAYACLGGCVGGSLVIENPYVARAKLLHLARKYGTEPTADRDAVRELFNEGHYNLSKPLKPRPMKPLDADLAQAIKKMKHKEGLVRTLPGVDCGVCGAPTCRAFADDVVRGEAELTDCIFVSTKRVEDLSKAYGIGLNGNDEDKEDEE
jgi:iron only hydrogenase large subunit-like protein